MRVPAPLVEHPVESVIAGLLLVALLFVTAGPEPVSGTVAPSTQTVAEKL